MLGRIRGQIDGLSEKGLALCQFQSTTQQKLRGQFLNCDDSPNLPVAKW